MQVMAKPKESKDEPQQSPEEIIRKALNVRRPAGGWPWDNKRKKPKKSNKG